MDCSILVLRNGKSGEIGKAIDLTNSTSIPPLASWTDLQPQLDKPWSILSDVERSIMNKMETLGTPMKEWDITINYGIKTGYNKAFIIDDATRQTLIDEDPNSAEIIKPVLRGRDIKRYKAKWAGLWLIDIHNGYNKVPAINIDDYPRIKTHLDKFYPHLKKRQDQGKTLYNLRSCAYYEDFAKEKLFWMDMSGNGRFAYSKTEIYCRNDGYMIVGNSLKYLCTVLNSNLVYYFMKQTATTLGNHAFRWIKVFVETIPIPKISTAEQQPFIQLVDKILSAKETNPSADTSKQEAEIDKLVYGLYDLTEREIELVENLK